MDSTVVCCFCGKQLPEADAALMVVYPTAERDESQQLYADKRCLVERLRPEVPHHPELDDFPGDE